VQKSPNSCVNWEALDAKKKFRKGKGNLTIGGGGQYGWVAAYGTRANVRMTLTNSLEKSGKRKTRK